MIVKRTLVFLKKDGFYLEIFLVTDEVMGTLNRIFRQKNQTTNVLSFPVENFFNVFDPRFRLLGEIYISPFYILSHNENLQQIVIHGLLHLLGYTHTGKNDTMKMQELEEKLIYDGNHHRT